MDFKISVGEVSVITYIINSLTEISPDGRVTKGLDKATARIVTDISDCLGLDKESRKYDSGNDEFIFVKPLNSLHIKWIKGKVNDLFEKSLMPIQFIKPALKIVDDWETNE